MFGENQENEMHVEITPYKTTFAESVRDYQEKVILIRKIINQGALFNCLKIKCSSKSECHSNLIAVCSTLRTKKIMFHLSGAIELAISR